MPDSPLPRTPEGEAVASMEGAEAYDRMNHAEVNRRFVDDVLAACRDEPAGDPPGSLKDRLRDGLNPLRVLDVGTGTGRIPIELGRRPLFVRVTLTDASEGMLARARKNVFASGLHGGMRLERADARGLPFEDGASGTDGGGPAGFGAVMSNSLLHHLETPEDLTAALAEMARVLEPGGLLFLRDLRRPGSADEVDRLVERHAAGEDAAGRELLRASLHAAFTAGELTDALAAAGAGWARAGETGDRHVTLVGVKPLG